MLDSIWGFLAIASLTYSLMSGTAKDMLRGAMSGASDAVALCISLASGYALFCGLIEIAKGAGVTALLKRMLSPAMRALFPSVKNENTRDAMVLNISFNMLGIGNAATPMGLEAMRLLKSDMTTAPGVRHAINMFLVVNATSVQLLPATILSLRAACGSMAPEIVILPILACTSASTLVGVACAKLCERHLRRG